MYQSALIPECKSGHGPMMVLTDPDGNPEAYYTITSPNLVQRFAFVAYRCLVCERVQFVDSPLPLERRIDIHPTLHARRPTDTPVATNA